MRPPFVILKSFVRWNLVPYDNGEGSTACTGIGIILKDNKVVAPGIIWISCCGANFLFHHSDSTN